MTSALQVFYAVFFSACYVPLWKILFPREHPRYEPPVVVADIPNVTFRGGLL